MKRVFATILAMAVFCGVPAHAQIGVQSCHIEPSADGAMLAVGGATIKVKFDGGYHGVVIFQAQEHGAGLIPVLMWVCNGLRAVSTYYGHFPVTQAEVDVFARPDGNSIGGTTWGGHPGVTGPYTRMRLGSNVTPTQLDEDWTMTHEFTHMAFPQLPENQHWAEEGMATYLEPIERVQAGVLFAKQVWHDIYRDMKQGEPQAGDHGLNNTHTWARTYWGGAMFWFAADVEIYKQTGGKKTLRDAMRAVVNAGGTIEREATLEDELSIGDRATGTTVLMDAYRAQANSPQSVDLDAIWKEIGVNADGSFDDHAPLAGFRKAVMQP